jgi:ketosteroid isomerase-like protein
MKTVTAFVIAFSIVALLQAQPAITKSQQAVQQTVIKMFDALSNRDSVNVKNYCAADILLFENGSTWNLDTLILKAIVLNAATDFKRTNTFDFINTKVNKNTAWVTYHLYSEIIKNGKPSTVQWMETVVAVKDKNSWKIKVLHSTLIKRS